MTKKEAIKQYKEKNHMLAFDSLKKPEEIRGYLKRILSRSGKKRENKRLYHYTSIPCISSMVNSGYLWLGSTDRMNDYLEGEFIQSAEKKLFFMSFSKVEENLAMYKMYAASPDGAMLSLSYRAAGDLVSAIPTTKSGKKSVRIVRDKQLTDETVEADVYWAEVCYKDLHTNKIVAGTVSNGNISNPLDEPGLAGFVKLFGWEYEKEVRLCATTTTPLKENEIVAIKLPDGLKDYFSIVTGPGFDKSKNKKDFSRLKRCGIAIHDSEYDALVDLGFASSKSDFQKIKELEEENKKLKKRLEELDDNDSDDDIDYDDDIWNDGYHEVKNGDGRVLKKGQFINETLIDGIEYNVVLRVSEGDEDSEKPVLSEEIKNEKWSYSEYGQYEGFFSMMFCHNDILETGLEFFYVVDKKVRVIGNRVKPTFTNFRTLESVLAEEEPDELEYIKTGIRKYFQTDSADIEV